MKLRERTMRRRAQQMSDERTREVLQRGTSGVLALLGDDDYPYALPISYALEGDRIYFHSAASGHKIDAIRGCDKASFCAIDHDEPHAALYTTFYRSVIAFGRVGLVSDDAERMAALRLLAEKYCKGESEDSFQREIAHSFQRTAVIVLHIEHLTGKESRHLQPKE